MRLAESVEGTTDVDGMLDRMSPQLFDEWRAKSLIEPLGLEKVAHVLTKIGLALAPDASVSDFMPWVDFDVERSGEVSPEQAAALFRALGARSGNHR